MKLSLGRTVLSLGLLGVLACGGSGSSSGDATGPEANPSSTATPPAPPAPPGTPPAPPPPAATKIQTVFLILMENHSWSTIKGSASAKYINGTLVPQGAHAEQYYTPAGNHPSEPNYIWLEAGDNVGITTDDDPDKNHKATTEHLSTQLEAAGVTWKAYAEDIPDGTKCPLTSKGLYGTKHTPQLFFDDVTDTNSPTSKHCIDHIRPYTEFATDLSANKVARYNFITPNLCNDMHGELGLTCPFGVTDMIKKGDDWLAAEIPKIQASQAYKDGGLVIVLFDEGDESVGKDASDGPIPAIFVGTNVKKGYSSNTKFTHSSMLRTMETLFGVPYLRGAKTSNDLSEMFTSFP
jgi:hypothetical protein